MVQKRLLTRAQKPAEQGDRNPIVLGLHRHLSHMRFRHDASNVLQSNISQGAIITNSELQARCTLDQMEEHSKHCSFMKGGRRMRSRKMPATEARLVMLALQQSRRLSETNIRSTSTHLCQDTTCTRELTYDDS